jgi:hypothetical protein
MNKTSTLFFFLLFTFMFAQGQYVPVGTIDIYISKQTGQTSVFSGSATKKTDQYENGTTTITVNGPLEYTLTPNDISIGPNQEKTWFGSVFGNVGAAPAPGSSVEASIVGNYAVQYSRPNASAPTGHEIVNKNGTETANFKIHSINVDCIDSLSICKGFSKIIPATGYPEGGKYTWSAQGALTTKPGTAENEIEVVAVGNGIGSVKVTYSIGGVSYSKTVTITITDEPIAIKTLDTLYLIPNETGSIKPEATPKGGVYKWEVSGKATLVSGPFNYVAFVKGGDYGETGLAKVTYTVCGKSASKTTVIKIKGCGIEVPVKVQVLKGKTTTATATGKPGGGTYNWSYTQGPPQQQLNGPWDIVEITGGTTNSASVSLKGVAKGNTTIYATYTVNGCSETKPVAVEVMDKLELAISPSANIPVLCKGGIQGFTATGTPPGGSYSWSSVGPIKFTSAVNSPYAWVEATGQGTATVTCTYSLDGESVTKSVEFKTREIKEVKMTANPAGEPIAEGTEITYTAQVIDMDGNDITAQTTLKWEAVAIPVGDENNVGNWITYDLGSGGDHKTQTWTVLFKGGKPIGNPPYKMKCWVQAIAFCPVRIGSSHTAIVRNK